MAERKRIEFKSAEQVADMLRNPFMSVDQVLDLLEDIQDVAEQRLETACKRMGLRLQGLDEAALGLAYERVMTSDSATPSDRAAYELMNACIHARFPASKLGYDWGNDTRDRIILGFARLEADFVASGKRHSEEQRARRKGKPASADDPRRHGDRNAEIKRRHAHLLAQGRHDATAQAATEFDLDPRTIRRIVKS